MEEQRLQVYIYNTSQIILNSVFFHPDNEGFAIKKNWLRPIEGEVVINKKVNSSFIGTNLEEFPRLNDITTV